MIKIKNHLLTKDVKMVANKLRPLFDELRGSSIFLTGGTGFFGKWLLLSFLEMRRACSINFSLTALSRDPQRFLHDCPEFQAQAGLEFMEGDVRTFEIPKQRAFDFVIHGAAAASAQLEQENPGEMYSVITEGTRHVLDFARKCSAKRLFFISSGAVYGLQPSTLNHIPETYEGMPESAYGKGKKVSEQMCLEAAAGRFDCVIARPFAFVGPYLPLDTHFAIGNFIRDCLEDRPIIITGDGTPLRSYMYAADLAEWLWTILLRGEPARAYNVGSDDAISISDLAHLVRECAGTQNAIVARGQKTEGILPARYVPSIDRAQKELDLSSCFSLSDAIYRTIDWHRTSQAKGSECYC